MLHCFGSDRTRGSSKILVRADGDSAVVLLTCTRSDGRKDRTRDKCGSGGSGPATESEAADEKPPMNVTDRGRRMKA